jgi:hypothetical protein
MQLVSYLTPSFWPGLKVLAHSLAHRGNIKGLDWIVMTDERAPDEWRDWFGYCGFNMIDLLFSQVGELPKKFPRTRSWLEFNWNKLRCFLLPEGEYVFLDADLLCMRDATELLIMPSISAAWDKPGGGHKDCINAGLIRFDASPELFDRCAKAIALSVEAKVGVGLAEQTILNYVLCRNHGLLQRVLKDEWNMPAFLATRRPELWRPEKARFIHYTGQTKPWMDGVSQGGKGPQKIWTDYANRLGG